MSDLSSTDFVIRAATINKILALFNLAFCIGNLLLGTVWVGLFNGATTALMIVLMDVEERRAAHGT